LLAAPMRVYVAHWAGVAPDVVIGPHDHLHIREWRCMHATNFGCALNLPRSRSARATHAHRTVSQSAGTEPKLKWYAELGGPNRDACIRELAELVSPPHTHTHTHTTTTTTTTTLTPPSPVLLLSGNLNSMLRNLCTHQNPVCVVSVHLLSNRRWMQLSRNSYNRNQVPI
jgi:hypothetical protein